MSKPEALTLKATPEETLTVWKRILNNYLQNANSGAYVTISPHSVYENMINFGTNLNEVSAVDIPVEDALGVFPTDNVEAALTYLITSFSSLKNVQKFVDATYVYLLGDTPTGWQVNRWTNAGVETKASGTVGKPTNLAQCQALTYS